MSKDNIENIYDLSPMQQGMLFHALSAPHTDPYCYQYIAGLKGDLDVPAFSRAWRHVVDRHQILRAAFHWNNIDNPLQIVSRRVRLGIEQQDWRGLSPDERRERLEAYIHADRKRGIDLSKAPLMRLSLLRLANDTYEFIWTFHHILLDGWSVPILLREVFVSYEAFHQGKDPILKLPRPYGDYIAWLRKQDLSQAERFWRRILQGVKAPPSLSALGGRTTHLSGYGGEILRLSETATSALQSLAQRRHITMSVIIQGAWALLLGYYGNQQDVVFGTVVSGRPHDLDGVEDMIGLFINTLPTRVQIKPEAELIPWLKELQSQRLEAQNYEYSPLTQTHRWSEIPRGQPLFESIVAFENYPISAVSDSLKEIRSDLSITHTRSFEQNSYPLSLIVVPNSEISLGISYDRNRFDASTVSHILSNLRALLEGILADQEQTLAELAPLIERPNYMPAGVAPPEPFDADYEQSNLTRSQLLFWTAQKLQPELPLFNMASLSTISSKIAPEKFQQAFQTLLNSSDALRIAVRETEGMPQQIVSPPYLYKMEYLDYSNRANPEEELRAWASVRAQSRLVMEERLFDSALIKLSDEKYAWYFNNHQIISDAWMSALILRLMSEFYRRALDGDLPDVVHLPPFQSYVEDERKHRGSDRYLKTEAYWKRKLEQEVEPINFYGRLPQKLASKVERITCRLGRERTEKLKALATRPEIIQTTGAPLFNLMAALLLVYLYRLSGNRTFSLGVPFHNRRSKVFKETLGPFMEVLPLIVSLDAEDTFLSLMNKVAVEIFEIAMRGGHAISNSLQKKVYDTLLNFHLETIPDFNGAQIECDWIHPGAGNETLSLHVHDFHKSGDLHIDFDFDCVTFDPEQRREAINQFLHVVDSCLEDAGRRLASVNLLSPEEKRRILRDFNRTEAAFPSDRTFPQLFAAQVGKTPHSCAVVFENQSLTYAQLNARANRVANHLRAIGVGPEQTVALLGWRGVELLAAIIGVMKAGAAYLPLDPYDPSKRHSQILRQSRCMVVLAAAEFVAVLQEGIDDLPPAQRPAVISFDELLGSRVSEADPPGCGKPKNLAYVIYTSGSTGAPKGVMIEQSGMINHLCAKIQDTRLTEADTLAQTASQCFDSSVWQFLAPLIVGGRVHIFNEESAHDPTRLMNELEKGDVTILSTVPSMLRAMLDVIRASDESRWSFPKLKCLLEMGEALPVDLCGQWMNLYPHVRLINAYGLTECSDDVTHYVVTTAPTPDQIRVPIGGPLANTRFHVLDRMLEPAPVGVIGELYVGGVATGRGYLHDPEQTASKFVPDPYGDAPGARLYKSGDLARYLNNGELDYLGRMDHQVKIRGFRIEFGEIEAALTQHPGVKESVAVARDDASGQARLVAYLVARDGYQLSAIELQSFIKERVPAYMVPSAFMILENMPLNSNGKIDRRALPAPDLMKGVTETYISPRDLLELQLAQIWRDLLGVELVGVNDNFFDLGGDSLLAVRMVARLQKRFKREIPLSSVIEAGTIESLAKILRDKETGSGKSPLVALQPRGSRPPFFCVHPGSGNVMCFLALTQRMDKDQPFYGIQDPSVLEDPGQEAIDVAASIEDLAARYIEALKTAQPHGPYHLGGWSFGGFVAFEMAQQLLRQGEEVGLLAILDTGWGAESLMQADDAELLAMLGVEVGLQISAEDLRPFHPQQRLQWLAERLKAANRFLDEIPSTWISFTLKVFKARLSAVSHHVFKPYPGRITLFRAAEMETDQSGFVDQFSSDPTKGWGRLSSMPVDVQVVPGNHATMVREPHVKVLAEKLTACLEKTGQALAVNQL